MEKRTLGSFLAVLRKANGMTQKELADQLDVSDKAVSRWERDECAPDLTLIPVIAEIFGVTCDELLRGQRSSPDTSAPESVPERVPKTQKQLNRILGENRTRLMTSSLLTLGIGITGLLAAMVCNLAFLRAYLGFFVGCGFFAAAGIMEAVFGIRAFSAVGSDDFDGEYLARYRRSLGDILMNTATGLLLLFSVTLPLLIFPFDPYSGLSGKSWLTSGLLFGLIAAAILLVLRWIISGIQIRRSPAGSTQTRATRHRLQGRIMVILAVVLAATGIAQVILNSYCQSELPFATGTVFYDADAFQAWALSDDDTADAVTGADFSTAISTEPIAGPYYYDENGQEITHQQLFEQAESGKDQSRINAILRLSNRSIAMVRSSGDDAFPITVFTSADWRHNRNILDNINTTFVITYILEIGVALLIYCRKRKQF